MRVRIDLKIIVFLILFLFTNQISVYLTMLIFCTLHEFGHIIAGLILKLKPENLEILPYGLSISFKLTFKAQTTCQKKTAPEDAVSDCSDQTIRRQAP